METETQEEKAPRKQMRPARLYAVVALTNEDEKIEIVIIESTNSKDMKKQLANEFADEKIEVIGMFRGRRIETKVTQKVDFCIN